MTDDERREREEQALDALIASFFHISSEDDCIPLDDPPILSDEDRQALESLVLPPDVAREIEEYRLQLAEEEAIDFEA